MSVESDRQMRDALNVPVVKRSRGRTMREMRLSCELANIHQF